MQRIFDIIFSAILIVLTAPLFIIVAILIAIFLGQPVLFKQKRPGWHAKPFVLYKFRTMCNTRDNSGELCADIERLNNFGKWLRKYSLDELPQLFNVLKGELSFVGPRPLLMEYLPLYTAEQARRHEVRPGITGWAQINGRNAILWEEKFNLDIWYVDNYSFLLNIKILWLTVFKVLAAKGVAAQGHPTMQKFTGISS